MLVLISNVDNFCQAYSLAKPSKSSALILFSRIDHSNSLNKLQNGKDDKAKSLVQKFMLGVVLLLPLMMNPVTSMAASEPLPSLQKCFDAVRKELDPIEGESLKRLSNDIQTNNWDDVKLFTREYDAGFRGYVMKSTWKQIEDNDIKKRGIEISNSFTFDLIALNKASRVKDTEDAIKRLAEVKQDLTNFLALESQIKTTN